MGKIRKRSRCPKCGSLNIIKWGVRSGHQRFKCKDCQNCFTPTRPDVSAANRFVWFRKWISGKQRIEDIAMESEYSSRQLRRWFDDYLASAPEWTIQRRKAYHVLIDGTWFSEGHCLIVYRDADSKSTIYYRFAEGENEYEIIQDLQMFKSIRLRISSFTTDGGEDIIRAIRTNNDKLYWIKELNKWHEDYEEFIKQKTVNKETGELTYTHDSVRRAYVHLHRAIPNMFKYIDEPDVPNNTNSLESFFGHLKDNLRIHRGLSQEHMDNFIKWYLFFADEKKRKDR